ncbi:hypothetical protein F4677DRAFT_253507 [Hypoxylon crocopeplum]|nr:hypothetical protein F4677DRAFT_253507 [Hypoxylon crocopeplum]
MHVGCYLSRGPRIPLIIYPGTCSEIENERPLFDLLYNYSAILKTPLRGLSDMMILAKLPFAAHAVIETAAALSFIFSPDKQLPGCNAAAKLILRQYGGLLLSTNLICLAILTEPSFTNMSRLLAAALGTYHIWPCYRAYVRIHYNAAASSKGQTTLGGPSLHLIVHLACLGMFIWASMSDISPDTSPESS